MDLKHILNEEYLTLQLSEKIKYLRTQLNLSQEELAKKMGLDRKQINRYEKNAVKPSIDTIVKLADAFKVRIDFLLRENEEEFEDIEIKDKELYMNCKVIDKMKADVRKTVNFVLKNIIMNGKSEHYFHS